MLVPSHRAISGNYRTYCDVIGCSVNQDGKSNGLVAPSGLAQVNCIKRAYEDAGITPDLVDYVEAHGIGTQLGDLIEVTALSRVFCGSRDGIIRTGSVKSNLGHLELAAGIAGFIKACLCLHYRYIPATIGVRQKNPKIPFEELKIDVKTRGSKWDSGSEQFCGVSSFGFGGTNCHVALKSTQMKKSLECVESSNEIMKVNDYTSITDKEKQSSVHMLCISAQTRKGLTLLMRRYMGLLNDMIENNNSEDLCHSMCITSYSVASLGSYRSAAIGCNAENLRDNLLECITCEKLSDSRPILVIPDHNGKENILDWRQLYFDCPLFRCYVDHVCVVAAPIVSFGLIYEAIYRPSNVEITMEIAHLISFAFHFALSKVWLHVCTDSPKQIVGHGLGEVIACVLSDTLTLNQGIILAASRARVLDHNFGIGSDPFDENHPIGFYYKEERLSEIANDFRREIDSFEHTVKFDIDYWCDQIIQKSFKDTPAGLCIEMKPAVNGLSGLYESIADAYKKGLDIKWDFLRGKLQQIFLDLPDCPWNHSVKVWNRKWFEESGVLALDGSKSAPPLCLSAMSEESLRIISSNYANLFESSTARSAHDICSGAALTTTFAWPHRLALTIKSKTESVAGLRSFGSGQNPSIVKYESSGNGETVWLFSGQGSQYPGMAKDLYSFHPVFRAAINDCAQILQPIWGRSLLEILDSNEIDSSENTQPALFAFEYSLAKLWMSWGVQPSAVMGHSVGEYVAACIAGVFSLEDGLKLITMRGKLIASLPDSGGMSAVFAPRSLIQSIFGNRISIAAFNGPYHFVVSGPSSTINDVCNLMRGKSKRLSVSHAFHSPMMNPILDEFEKFAQKVTYKSPKIPIVLNVTGEFASPDSICSEYLKSHISQPVQFHKSMITLAEKGFDTYLEIGPHPILLGMAVHCIDKIVAVPSMRRKQPLAPVLNDAICTLFSKGALQSPHLVFAQSSSRTPLLGTRVESSADMIVYEAEHTPHSSSDLQDHRLGNDYTIVYPAAGYLSIVLEALTASFGEGLCTITDVEFQRPLILSDSTLTRLSFSRISGHTFSFTIQSRVVGSEFVQNAMGTASHSPREGELRKYSFEPSDDFETIHDFYGKMEESGFKLGPSFQYIQKLQLHSSHEQAIAYLRPHIGSDHEVYPGLIDSVLQVIGLFTDTDTNGSDYMYLPVQLGSFKYYMPFSSESTLMVRRKDTDNTNEVIADYQLVDSGGNLVIEITGLVVKRVRASTLLRGSSGGHSFHSLKWESSPIVKSNDYERGIVVIFAASQEPAASLRNLLEEDGNTCVMILPKSKVIQWSGPYLGIDENDPKAFNQIWTDMDKSMPIVGVIDLWGAHVFESKTDYITMGVDSLNQIAHSMVEHSIKAPLFVVTRNCQNVQRGFSGAEFDAGTLCTPMWGMMRTLRIDNPEHKFFCIDLDNSSAVKSEREAYALVNELKSDLHELEVSYKMIGGDFRRSVARIHQFSPRAKSVSQKLQSNSTWLITGGIGDLGLYVANWLAENGVKFLALCDNREPLFADLEKIDHIKSLGVNVQFFLCDLCVKSDVETLLKAVQKKMPSISSVLHLAGKLLEDSLLNSPKLLGAMHLNELTENLETFVLFSSVASFLGSPHQNYYSAANAYLDGLAEHRNARGEKTLAINWGPWARFGMAHKTNLFGPEDVVEPEFCLESLGVLLNTNEFSAAVVSKQLLMKYARDSRNQIFEFIRNEAKGDEIAELLMNLNSSNRQEMREILESFILNEVLKLTDSDKSVIDRRSSLSELGLDSLMSMELRSRLSEVTGLSLSTTVIIEFSSVEGLAEHMLDSLLGTEENVVEEKVQQDVITCKRLGSHGNGDENVVYCVPGIDDGGSSFSALTERLSSFDVYECSIKQAVPIPELGEALAEIIDTNHSVESSLFLVGFSYGASILWEAADRLLERGRKIKCLCIVDWVDASRRVSEFNFESEYIATFLDAARVRAREKKRSTIMSKISGEWNKVRRRIDCMSWEKKVQFMHKYLMRRKFFVEGFSASDLEELWAPAKDRFCSLAQHKALPIHRSSGLERILYLESTGLVSGAQSPIRRMNWKSFYIGTEDCPHIDSVQVKSSHYDMLSNSEVVSKIVSVFEWQV